MRYLLDTCVISEVVRPRPDARVMEWMEQCPGESAFLSVLTLGQIQKGIRRLTDTKRRNTIQRWLDNDLRTRFEDRILSVDEDVALTWGLIQSEAERRGATIPVIDGLIAATAITRNITVATRNEQDMTRTGALVVNPWKC